MLRDVIPVLVSSSLRHTLFLALLSLSSSAFAAGGIASATASAPAGCVLIDPAANAPSLADQGIVIEVVITSDGVPVADYPRQDIWISDVGNGDLVICNGGIMADANTDANGRTTISGIVAGAGWTQNGVQVYVAGNAAQSAPLDIEVVSTDLTRDGLTNMLDIGPFAAEYSSAGYDFRVDLNCNGAEDLEDVARFAGYFANQFPICP